MMSKKFSQGILHFGLDKTGSTSLQQALDGLRQPLLSLGLLAYPPGRWHAQLGSCFCGEPERYIFNKLSGFSNRTSIMKSDKLYLNSLVRWLETVFPTERLLFSYEGFSDLDEPSLGRLRDFCLEWSDELSVIVYVRPPLSYAVSSMSQRVQMGNHSWPTDVPPVYPHAPLLKRAIKVFGKKNIKVKNFDLRSLRSGDVVTDFLSLIGVNSAEVGWRAEKQSNESLTKSGQSFGDALISHLEELGCTHANGEFHRKFGQFLTSIPGTKLALSKGQAKEVLRASKPHSLFLQKNFGIKFDEDEANLISTEVTSNNLEPKIEGFASFFANVIKEHTRVQDGKGSLLGDPVVGDLLVEEDLRVPLTLVNESSQSWVGSKAYPIGLSYQWINASGNGVPHRSPPVALPGGYLGVGESVKISLPVHAPSKPGEYKLRILPVQDRVCWFEQLGFTPLEIFLRIVDSGRTRCLPGSDLRFQSIVGVPKEKQLIATGEQGFLLFGPYAKAIAGLWQVTVEGEFILDGQLLRADVVVNQGETIISEIVLRNTCLSFQMSFELKGDVQDLEVRVWVQRGIYATIDAVNIAPEGCRGRADAL